MMSFDRQVFSFRSLPFNLLTHGLHFGAVSFFCYVTLLLLLGPIWGWHLYDMGEWVSARAEYLRLHGGQPHRALTVFREFGIAEVYQSGALLGFLFLAWPWALWLGLLESSIFGIKSRTSRWFGRIVGVLVAWLALGDLIWPFASTTPSLIWAMLLSLAIPALGSKCFTVFRNGGLESVKRRPWLLVISMTPFVLSAAIHPVWDYWLRPHRFEGLLSGTVIRDMLLLNRDGEHWFNTWYYDHSPLLMERERVTQFQPMTVATCGVGDHWLRLLTSDVEPQPIFTFELKGDLHEARVDLENGHLDHLVLSRSFWEESKLDVRDFPDGALTVLSYDVWPEANGVWQFDREIYFLKNADGGGSVLQRRLGLLRQQGYDAYQSEAVYKAKRGLFFLLSNPAYMIPIATVFISGVLYWVIFLLGFLGKRPLGVLLVVAVVAIWLYGSDPLEKVSYWRGEQECSYERIRLLHHMATRFSLDDVEEIMGEPFPKDMRLLMLSVSILGRGMNKVSDPNQLALIDLRVAELLDNYHSYPLNLRYKIVEAFSSHPKWKLKMEEFCLGETHPYVAWYMSRCGLRPIN